MVTKNAGADAFAGKAERDHDHPRARDGRSFGLRELGTGLGRERDAGEADTVIGERDDLEFEFGVIRKREVVGFGFLAHGTHGIHGNRPDQEKDSVFFPIPCVPCVPWAQRLKKSPVFRIRA